MTLALAGLKVKDDAPRVRENLTGRATLAVEPVSTRVESEG